MRPQFNYRARDLAIFAGPAAPISALGLPLAVYLPPFYAELGLSLTAVGAAFMLLRFWDVFTDPVIGMITDRTRSRWGRRKPWILAAVPLLLVSVWFIFFPPEQVSLLYLYGWMFILYVGWTMLTLSHMSWAAELSPDYNERSRIQGWREAYLIGGMVFVLAIPAALEIFTDGVSAADRMGAMGWFILISLPIAVGLAVWRIPKGDHTIGENSISFKAAFAQLLANAPLRRLLLVDVLAGLAGGIVASLFLFLAQDRLGIGGESSIVLVGYFVSSVVFLPAIMSLSYRIGKHKTLALSSLYTVFTLPFIFLIPKGEFWLVLVLWIIFGINAGASSFLNRSIVADIIDLDQTATGAKQTGVFYALLTMTAKIGYALAVGLGFLWLDQIGYQAGGPNSESTLTGLTIIYVVPPTVIALINAFLMWRFPLGQQEQEKLRAKLADQAAE